MVFAMQFGSLLDGILIGNFIGEDALTASALVVPILYIIQLPGFALGVGGSIVIANLLGKRDLTNAKKTFSLAIIIGMSISVLFAGLGALVSHPLANLFSEDLSELSYQYILGYMVADPIITLALILGSFMAVDNNPRLSSILFIVSNIAKILLEILFLKTFGSWSTFGAALSTGAGYFIGLLTTFAYFKSNKRNLTFSFKVKGAGFKNIAKASSTAALNLFLTAIQFFVVNIFIGPLLTEGYEVAAYGLVANMVFLFDLVCGGIINVIPTICGIFYGEKDIYSLKKLTRRIYLINLIVTCAMVAFIAILPNVYGMMFGSSNLANPDYTALVLRIYVFSFIPYSISKFSMTYYPSIDKNMPSLITVLCRELIVALPVALPLILTLELEGYVIAYVIIEAATVIVTYVFILIYEKVKCKNCKGLFMFEKEQFKSYDVTITNELENASVISENITKFALENGVPNRESQFLGLASEEMVSNIALYGYKKEKQNYIDISLKINENNVLLRIRDDGLPFDPTKYEFDNNENYSTSGIQLISNLVNKISYTRVLNLNNTIFEFNLGGNVDGNQNNS